MSPYAVRSELMTPDALARVSGWLYVAATIAFIVASLARSSVFETGNTAETADRIRASMGLVRIGLTAELTSIFAFLATAIALYLLLARIDQLAGATMVMFVVVGVPVGMLAVASQYAALTIASGPAHTVAAAPGVADAFAGLLGEVQGAVRLIHEVIAGLWLLPLGYLVIASGYFPRLVGVLLFVAGFGWLAHLGVVLLAPQLSRPASYLVLGAIGEVVFMVWLVVKGANVTGSN